MIAAGLGFAAGMALLVVILAIGLALMVIADREGR